MSLKYEFSTTQYKISNLKNVNKITSLFFEFKLFIVS